MSTPAQQLAADLRREMLAELREFNAACAEFDAISASYKLQPLGTWETKEGRAYLKGKDQARDDAARKAAWKRDNVKMLASVILALESEKP